MTTVIETPDPATLLTPAEVASLFNVTPKTVGRWDAAGILPALRTRGGHRRFPAGAVYRLRDLLEGVGEP
ncbi:helix-turn-helix domain-containing protein [Aquihabitans sp. McL0605]|uniref:helix-turn-helix domain-containing protein n=1 Tax=Aquihabitans sp. McL0605 TaxID=3415671 RepID=UPI003CED1BB6